MNEDGESSKGNSDRIPHPLASSSSVIEINDTDDESVRSNQSSVTITVGRNAIRSMFRTSNDGPKRNVNFADDQNKDLVSYQEPSHSEWNGVRSYAVTDIVNNYFKACTVSDSIPEDSILVQLRGIRNNVDYSATLNLTEFTHPRDVVETLETIFRMVTFHTLYLGKCMAQFISDIFDMIEYYNSVEELVLTHIDRDDTNTWHSIANTLSNSEVLYSISFREMSFGDTALRILFEQGINCSRNIKKIRFDACGLSRAPAFMLGHHLKNNEFLRELHLCYLNLYSKEAEILGKFLSVNESLRILNLSNNKLGDHGFEVLSYGLMDQAERDRGVEVLNLYNNKLTKRCVDSLDGIISSCPLVHTINVGLNELTDIAIFETMESIENSRTLRALGLQSTLLTCHGIVELAKVCEKNKSLRHLNLRGNKAIQPTSLNKLANVIHNTSLIQIDLDDKNRTCCYPKNYVEIVNKVRQVLAINKAKLEEEHPFEDLKWTQQHFLACEPTYAPRNTIRTTRSSYSHRFNVQPVSENVSPQPRASHRFTVVPTTSAASGDSATSSASTGECKTSGVIATYNKSINVGGDAGSLMSQDLINRNDCADDLSQSLSQQHINDVNVDEKSRMEEEEDEKNSIITVSDESKYSNDNESAQSDFVKNANVPKDIDMAEAATSVPAVDDMDTTMDTTDDATVVENEESSDDSGEIGEN